jgi:hypothetical protein
LQSSSAGSSDGLITANAVNTSALAQTSSCAPTAHDAFLDDRFAFIGFLLGVICGRTARMELRIVFADGWLTLPLAPEIVVALDQLASLD